MPTLGTILEARRRRPPFWCGISDRHLFREISTWDYLNALFRTRADILMWREKDLARDENRAYVKEGVRRAREVDKLFLVSSDCRLALEERADGAHLASDQDLEAACGLRRELAPAQFLLGKSVHSVAAAVQAESQGADYVLLAPVFDPISKPAYRKAIGLDGLQETANSVTIPVLALGGITEANGPFALAAGAFGLAGITLLIEEIDRILNCPRRLP